MNSFPRIPQIVLATSFLLFSQAVVATTAYAHPTGAQHLHFQRPGQPNAQSERVNKNFRRPQLASNAETRPEVKQVVAPVRAQRPIAKRQPAAQPKVARVTSKVVRTKVARKAVPVAVKQKKVMKRDRQVASASHGREAYVLDLDRAFLPVSHGCDTCDGHCTCEVSCGMGEPGCGIYESGCGIAEPGCGFAEPDCGIGEPGCGIGEPSCSCAEPSCGSCVALPGSDYWCFPVCLPRFKDLSAWAGVQGFRGPRDFAPLGNQGRSDSNFGFHQGINLSGRAPLVGLLFPQLSYQLGYQAVQSRLNGTTTSVDDRSQQFVTGGFFRRVKTGLQFGVVWDMLRDDLDTDIDLHQVRSEISLKSPQGREIGFWTTTSTNDSTSLGVAYETVDQYALFYRWHFGRGYESRLWGGATENGEGLFGGEFSAPMSDRWTLHSGFNYLITDEPNGLAGVSEESWNIGINLVWHLGKTARSGVRSPYRPLFGVADNGWMFVDRVK